ncbi:MAG TPA: hypothetical protein ENI81_10430, partial [Phycisphaerales bacterium]|nr:hypothetical protein [Phycisphaerales bacterium]
MIDEKELLAIAAENETMTWFKNEEKTMKPGRNAITLLVMAILATMFGQIDVAKSQVVTDGLLSYWTLDAADIDGQTVKDAWGDRDGKIIGNTHSTAGRIGDALTFDGDGDYVDFDPSGLPEGDASRTMA